MRMVALFMVLMGCQPIEPSSWVEVERGALSIDVEVSGTMRAVDADRVGPPGVPGMWNFKIAMMADEGAVAEAGQPILMFDSSELAHLHDQKTSERDSAATQLQLKVAAARVARQDEHLAIAEAQAKLRKARLTAEAPEEVTPGLELKKARLDVELAELEVAYLERKAKAARRRDEAEIARWRRKRDRAEARVREIGEAIEKMSVPSPRTGTVIYNADWQGNKKKVGDNAWRAETVLQIVSLDEMEGHGEVDEVDVSKIAVGQSVALRLDARPDLELRGRIRAISPTVERASPETPLKIVRVDISLEDDGGSPLRPGMRFRGEVETDRIEDVLLVPLDAVLATPNGPVVQRRGSHGLETVPIEVGRSNARQVIVTQGLDEGDAIVRGAGV